MKKKQRELMQEKLPSLLPKIQKLLKDEGLDKYLVSAISMKHLDELKGGGEDMELCRMIVGSKIVWKWVPKGECPG